MAESPMARAKKFLSADGPLRAETRSIQEVSVMATDPKAAYTDKQKRKAEHIAEGYRKEGVSAEVARERAWATVNKQDGGGKKSGSGRKNSS